MRIKTTISIVFLAIISSIFFDVSIGHAQWPFPETGPTSKTTEVESSLDQTDCIQCGTLVDWIEDNDAAFAKAKETGKLVYMLHLSGNLKNWRFT